MFICDNLSVGANGHLLFAGQDTADLAARYGTPLYLMDEDRIRHNCRQYTETFKRVFAPGSRVLYASKAAAFKQMYRIVQEEGVGVDVVSVGELYTAVRSGFDPANAYFHGNNKTDADIAFAMEQGIGHFVADNEEELRCIDAQAAAKGIRQKVLLRLTPGIDTHTYEAVNTGLVDSKFGQAIETGQAEAITALTLGLKNIELEGFHCHVGSQVFAEDVFERSAVIMLEFMARIRAKYGYTALVLDLGGGYGVRYVEDDPAVDIPQKLRDVAEAVNAACARLDYPVPAIVMEPGRSIVADAGLTLYRVGTVKRIPGYKNYVSVDGGMTDNPRFALYRSRYTCLPAERMNAARGMECSVVGRCCESGDIIQEHVAMPEDMHRGELLAVCTTGAYNYSMASNYNRIARPPVVMLRTGESYVAVRRETIEDMAALDI